VQPGPPVRPPPAAVWVVTDRAEQAEQAVPAVRGAALAAREQPAVRPGALAITPGL